MDNKKFMYSSNLRSPEPTNAERCLFRSAKGRNKKRQRHSAPGGRVAVCQLAFEQMIDFCADGLEIIQTEVYNGIADVRNLVHFL